MRLHFLLLATACRSGSTDGKGSSDDTDPGEQPAENHAPTAPDMAALWTHAALARVVATVPGFPGEWLDGRDAVTYPLREAANSVWKITLEA